MNQAWNKIKTRLSKIFNASEEKEDYLSVLIENLKTIQKDYQHVPFEIISVKRKGFVVKTGGLFAFVSFNYMPWKYRSIEQWQAIAEHLIGKNFYGQIYSISEVRKPISIRVNAENHHFPQKGLREFEEYTGAVVHKTKYGLFVDIGYHYDWKYGSFVGLVRKSNFKNDEELKNIIPGEIITTYFHGYTKDNRLILGNADLQKEWFTGELEPLIGTRQTATVKINEQGRKEFFINNKFRTSIPVTKLYYPNSKTEIKNFLNGLNDTDTIECEITKIGKRKNFVSKLI